MFKIISPKINENKEVLTDCISMLKKRVIQFSFTLVYSTVKKHKTM